MGADTKTMFEIYRDPHDPHRVGVVYFTELEEHERDRVLAKIASATSIYRGFLRDETKAEAKRIIEALLAGDGQQALTAEAIDARLRPFLAG